MSGRIHLWSHLVLDLCLLEVLKLQFSISLLVIVLFMFSISCWFSLGRCAFLGICPFLLVCPFHWHIVVHNSLLWTLHFCVICLIFPFSFLILLIWALFLFSWWVWTKVISFVYLIKELALSFTDLFYCFLISDSLTFALIFMISFFLLILGFAFSSSPGSFRCNVWLIFSLFPEVKFYYYTHPS